MDTAPAEEWAEDWRKEFPDGPPPTEDGYDGYLHALESPE